VAKPTTPSIDPADQQTVNLLSHQLNLLLTGFLQASRATTDLTKLLQINNEMMGIQALIDQGAQAQAAADDSAFTQATASLKTQSGMLNDMGAQVAQVVSDADSAGKIVGYITQALALIAKL